MHFIETFVENIIQYLGDNLWLGLLVAPFLGLIMSFMPCCLANVGLVIGVIDKNSQDLESEDSYTADKRLKKKRALRYSLLFAFGSVLVFFVIGLSVGLIGSALSSVEWLFHIIVGLSIAVVSVYYIIRNLRHSHHCCGHENISQGHNVDNGITLNAVGCEDIDNMDLKDIGDIELSKDTVKLENCDCHCDCHARKSNNNSYKVFMLGVVGAIFNTPCSVPALIAILAFAAGVGSAWIGIAMILLYALGHSVLIVVAGVSANFVKQMQKLHTHSQNLKVVKIILLVLLIAFAGYIIYEGLAELIA